MDTALHANSVSDLTQDLMKKINSQQFESRDVRLEENVNNHSNTWSSSDDVFDDLQITPMQESKTPTAKSSSTCHDLLSIPSLQSPVERVNSIIVCPNNTCQVSQWLQPVDPNDTPPPPFSRSNYPILCGLTEQENENMESSPQDSSQGSNNVLQDNTRDEVHQRRSTETRLRPRNQALDYFRLHNFGKEGRGAWCLAVTS